MDVRIRERIDAKVAESVKSAAEIRRLAEVTALPSQNIDDIILGIVTGRLYNAFWYQTRRILGRDPLPSEFEEFVGIISENREKLRDMAYG